jgi:hypothetical protein
VDRMLIRAPARFRVAELLLRRRPWLETFGRRRSGSRCPAP